MNESDAITACDIIYHIEELRKAMGTATMDEFVEDPSLFNLGSLTLINVISAVGDADKAIKEIPNAGIWQEVRDMRNEVSHIYGSIDVDKFYKVLTETLPRIETALRKRILDSIFSCEEIHERIGLPSPSRDIGRGAGARAASPRGKAAHTFRLGSRRGRNRKGRAPSPTMACGTASRPARH